METTIKEILKANDKDGYLIAVSDELVKCMHQINFGWVLSTVDGVHLATSYVDVMGEVVCYEQKQWGCYPFLSSLH